MQKGRQVDPKAFGRRVRELREARGYSQEDLALVTNQSQSNIDWIEKGGPKKPERQVFFLATALRTTNAWLLYAEGPRDIGPNVLSPKQIAESYELLSPSQQEQVSEFFNKLLPKKQKSKKSA